MTQNTYRDEYGQLFDINKDASIGGWLSIGGMCISLGTAFYLALNPLQAKPLAKVLALESVIFGSAALYNSKISNRTKGTLQDFQDVNDQQRTNRMYLQAQPVVELAASKILEPFNWSNFNVRYNEYPHIGIVGSSGAGKTLFTMWLTEKLGGLTIVVDPHYEIGKWQNASITIANRDGMDAPINIKSEPEIAFTDILSGDAQPTIPQFIHSWYGEMNDRLEMDEHGKLIGRHRAEINCIFEEYNSYGAIRGAGEVLKRTLRQARKIKMRNILILQATEVAALGIEGEGSARKNLVLIRLGKEAVSYAEANVLMRQGEEDDGHWKRVLKQLKEDTYPCLVNDDYAKVPHIVANEL